MPSPTRKPQPKYKRVQFGNLGSALLKNNGTPYNYAIVYGRMNPLTIGHVKVIRNALYETKPLGIPLYVIVSHSQNKNRNPLDPNLKIRLLKHHFKNQNMIKFFHSSSENIPAATLGGIIPAIQTKQGGGTGVVISGSNRKKGTWNWAYKPKHPFNHIVYGNNRPSNNKKKSLEQIINQGYPIANISGSSARAAAKSKRNNALATITGLGKKSKLFKEVKFAISNE